MDFSTSFHTQFIQSRAIFQGASEGMKTHGSDNAQIPLSRVVDACRLAVRAMVEYENRIVCTDSDELLSVGGVGQERGSRRVCGGMSVS